MKRLVWLLVPVILVAFSAPLFAGHGKGNYEKCTAGTQECLDMMASHYKDKGWIGIHADRTEEGKLLVSKIVEGSPAEEAGLAEGDVFFAISGVEYNEANQEKLEKVQKSMTPGKTFTITITRDGNNKDIDITLGSFPEEQLAKMIGGHMLEHANATNAEEE